MSCASGICLRMYEVSWRRCVSWRPRTGPAPYRVGARTGPATTPGQDLGHAPYRIRTQPLARGQCADTEGPFRRRSYGVRGFQGPSLNITAIQARWRNTRRSSPNTGQERSGRLRGTRRPWTVPNRRGSPGCGRFRPSRGEPICRRRVGPTLVCRRTDGTGGGTRAPAAPSLRPSRIFAPESAQDRLAPLGGRVRAFAVRGPVRPLWRVAPFASATAFGMGGPVTAVKG
jgi:hypothetical protein